MTTPIAVGQTWRNERRVQLSSSSIVRVVGFEEGGDVVIARYYPGRQERRKDTISPKFLRRHYKLVGIQEELL